jgi:predicted HTH transcriptional regulator
MEVEQLEQLLFLGEQRGVEFKIGGPITDGLLFARVTRAVLAMANKRDGGRVLVGVDDEGTPSGVTAADLATWIPDHVRDKLAVFAEPFVSVEIEVLTIKGASIVLLQVAEFEEIPVICRKAFDPNVLREGTIYIRSRRKPESIAVATQIDMRDLIDLATEKQLAKFRRQAGIVGLAPAIAIPTDADKFTSELGGFPR